MDIARRTRGRPTGGEPVVDRERLLDAAERVIARDGSGASLEAVAVEAGVTKPIVYARVGARAELSNALAERLIERLVAAAAIPLASGRVDRPTLAGFLKATLVTLGEHRELFTYVTRGSADDSSERALYLAGRSAIPLAQLLADWRTQAGADANVALPWAYGLIGMLNMVALWWIDDADRSADELTDQLAELLWSGLGLDSA